MPVQHPPYIPTRDVAELLGVTPETIVRWADDPSVPLRCIRTPGGHRRFDPADVDEFVQSLRTWLAVQPSPSDADDTP